MLLYFNLINGTSSVYNFNCIIHANHMGSHIGRTLLLRSLLRSLMMALIKPKHFAM